MKLVSIKNLKIALIAGLATVTVLAILDSCKTSRSVAAKTGVQLWAENCQRCHNTPSPSSFSPEQWETIGMHMQSRALLTNEERDKIVRFLKQ